MGQTLHKKPIKQPKPNLYSNLIYLIQPYPFHPDRAGRGPRPSLLRTIPAPAPPPSPPPPPPHLRRPRPRPPRPGRPLRRPRPRLLRTGRHLRRPCPCFSAPVATSAS